MLSLTVVTLLHFTPHPLEVLGLSSLKTAPLQACQCPSAVAVPGTCREYVQDGKEAGVGQGWPQGPAFPLGPLVSLPMSVRHFPVACAR